MLVNLPLVRSTRALGHKRRPSATRPEAKRKKKTPSTSTPTARCLRSLDDEIVEERDSVLDGRHLARYVEKPRVCAIHRVLCKPRERIHVFPADDWSAR